MREFPDWVPSAGLAAAVAANLLSVTLLWRGWRGFGRHPAAAALVLAAILPLQAVAVGEVMNWYAHAVAYPARWSRGPGAVPAWLDQVYQPPLTWLMEGSVRGVCLFAVAILLLIAANLRGREDPEPPAPSPV